MARITRLFVSMLVAASLAAACLAAQAKPPQTGQAGPPQAQAPKPKKPPSAKLAEPWPDAAELAARRAEAEALPLFQQSEPLVFTLAADFKAINRDRNPNSTKTYPGVLTAEGTAGTAAPAPLHVTLRTRGISRLNPRACAAVPLAIDFVKKDVKGTVFDGQNKLKLITHCQNYGEYDQYVLLEYLTYRLHNLLTPRSFRVRLARATYVDSTSGKPITTRNAVFIEDDSDLAARLEGRAMALPRMMFKDFDQSALIEMMVFQYVIGNTDFSIYALHNVRQVQTVAKVFYPIFWDFDISGLVSVPYGKPDPRLGITSARERLYRGPCVSMAEFEPTLAIIRQKQAEALALFDLPALEYGRRRDAKEFLQEFFRLLDRPSALKRELVDKCEKQPTM